MKYIAVIRLEHKEKDTTGYHNGGNGYGDGSASGASEYGDSDEGDAGGDGFSALSTDLGVYYEPYYSIWGKE